MIAFIHQDNKEHPLDGILIQSPKGKIYEPAGGGGGGGGDGPSTYEQSWENGSVVTYTQAEKFLSYKDPSGKESRVEFPKPLVPLDAKSSNGI